VAGHRTHTILSRTGVRSDGSERDIIQVGRETEQTVRKKWPWDMARFAQYWTRGKNANTAGRVIMTHSR